MSVKNIKSKNWEFSEKEVENIESKRICSINLSRLRKYWIERENYKGEKIIKSNLKPLYPIFIQKTIDIRIEIDRSPKYPIYQTVN
jgi:hypothetical protein